MEKPDFGIECLDHVAIRVLDIKISQKWYEEVLGLTAYQLPEWGDIPIFLLAGSTGIALFPATSGPDSLAGDTKGVKIDHFAFRLSKEDFEKARRSYEKQNIDYHFQDHVFFHSIYTKDPDGHTVELTTLVVNKSEFYK